MNRTPRILGSLAALATTAVLAACTTGGVQGTTSGSTSKSTATALAANVTVEQARASNATPDAADTSWSESGATVITLNGTSATVSGSGATASGSTVTITAGGTYVLSGTFEGQVIVNSASSDEVKLVLKGATITSSTGAAIAITDAGEAVVVLADGTTNSLTDAKTYADTTSEDAPNAALFSMADLTIGGGGSLTVTGQYNDGIASKDGLVISGGTITVKAADDGIRGKDHIAITAGTISVDAGGDALKSDNTKDADSGFVDISGGTIILAAGTKAGDGIDAQNDIIVSDGKLTVTQSYEGIEALNIVIGGGTIEVTSSDDGLNVSAGKDSTTTTNNAQGGPGGGAGDAVIDGTASISGGTLILHSNGDGFDSNGTASISGGTVIVDQVGGGNGALDVNGTFTITGGTLIAVGSSSMPVAPATSSAQGWVMAAVSGQGGSKIQVLSGTTVLAEFTATREFGNIVYSGTGISSGQQYSVTVNGTATTVTANVATAGGMGGGMGGGQAGGQPGGQAGGQAQGGRPGGGTRP